MTPSRFAIALLAATSAAAAPTSSGGPQFTTANSGAAFSGYRSRYAIKADVTSARAGEAAALALYDARTGAAPSRRLGTFSVRFSDSSGARLPTGRDLHFEPTGWTEARTDGVLTADVSVMTLAHDAFAVVVELHGVASALDVEGLLDGTVSASGDVSAAAAPAQWSVQLDDGAGRPFGVALASPGGTAGASASGASYSASVHQSLVVDGTVAFVLAFHDGPAQAAPHAAAVIGTRGEAAAWTAAVRSEWQQLYSAFAPPQDSDLARRSADEWAAATLWHNELGPSATEVRGGLPAKTLRDHFEARPTALQAMALAEHSPDWAFAELEGAYRGQWDASAGAEKGLIPHSQDEDGAFVPLGVAGAIDAYSELPAFGWALRAIQDRGGAGDARLARALDVGLGYTTWWRARRDHDADGIPELNGAVEAGQPGAPRFTEVWGADALVPVSDLQTRARFDAVDLASELGHEYIELSRVAMALGRPEADDLLSRASLLFAQLEDGTYGCWDDTGGRYADFTLVGTARERSLVKSHAASMLWPLAAGAVRDVVALKRDVAVLTSPDAFWMPNGVTSLARFELDFSPAAQWRGALSPEEQYLAMVGLYRYGYEAEAEQLRQKLLELVTSESAPREFYDATTGLGLGAAGFGPTAAVYLEALRNRHQAETFVLSEGGVAKERTGQIRRMFGLDGRAAFEASTEGSSELPVVRLSSAQQLFSAAPMAIELSDPHGLIGERAVTISLPAFDRATFKRTSAGGAVEQWTAEKADGVSLSAHAGDRIDISNIRMAGELGLCGCSSLAGAVPGGALLILAAAARLARRRRPL